MPPRRPKTKQKLPPPKPASHKPSEEEDDSKAEEKFKVELLWCIQQLETAMQKTSLKEKDDMSKAHRSLTSAKVPLIKKRQVMNSLFGDYRTKMAEEEAKIKIDAPKVKKQSVTPSKSVFLRKTLDQIPTTNDFSTHSQDDNTHATLSQDDASADATQTTQTTDGHDNSLPQTQDTSTEIHSVAKTSVRKADTKQTLSTYFKSGAQDKEEFKFNFSSVS